MTSIEPNSRCLLGGSERRPAGGCAPFWLLNRPKIGIEFFQRLVNLSPKFGKIVQGQTKCGDRDLQAGQSQDGPLVLFCPEHEQG